MSRGGVHLHTTYDDDRKCLIRINKILTSTLDLHLAVVAGRVMLGQEAVVTEQLASLVVIFLVDKSRVALVAGEALVMPVSLSIKHQVLHMDWQLTSLAVLCHRLRLDIPAPSLIE